MNILTLFLLYVIYLILMVMVRLISISLLLVSLIIRGRLLVRVLWGLWWWRVGVWVFWVLGELCTIFILRVGLGIRGIEDGRINDFQMLLFLYFGPIVQYLQLISFMEMVLNQRLKDMNTFST